MSGVTLVVGAGLSHSSGWAAAAVFFALTAAALVWRRRSPLRAVTEAAGVVAFVAPIGLWLALTATIGAEFSVAFLAAAGLFASAFTRVFADEFLALWSATLVAAVAVMAGASIGAVTVGPWWLVATIWTCAVAAAIGRGWPIARIWLTGGVTAIALAVTIDAVGWDRGELSIVVSLVGLAAVVLASGFTSRRADHVAAVGVAASACMVAASTGTPFVGWPGPVVWWCSVAMAIVTAVAAHTDRGSMNRIIERHVTSSAARMATAVHLLVATPVAVGWTTALWTITSRTVGTIGTSIAFTGVVASLVTRVHRVDGLLRAVFAHGGTVVAIGGLAVAMIDPALGVPASLLVVAGVISVDPDRRPVWTVWAAWLATGVGLLAASTRWGVSETWHDIAMLSWSVALVVGGLLADRLGRRSALAGAGPAAAPVALGAVCLPFTLAAALLPTASEMILPALVLAGLSAVAAHLVGRTVAWVPMWAFAVFAAGTGLTWAGLDRLTAYAAVAALVLAGAAALNRAAGLIGQTKLLIGAGLATAGLSLGLTVLGAEPVPWLILGVTSITIAAVWPGRPWLDVGLGLSAVGAALLSWGAVSAVAGAVAIRAMAATRGADEAQRRALHVGSGLAVGAAWVAGLAELGWTLPRLVAPSAIFVGATSLAGATAIRLGRFAADTVRAWSGWTLASVGLVLAVPLAELAEPATIGHGMTFGIGLVLAATFVGGPRLPHWVRASAPVLAAAMWISFRTVGRIDTAASVAFTAWMAVVMLLGSALAMRDGRSTAARPAPAVAWGVGAVVLLTLGVVEAVGLEPRSVWAHSMAPALLVLSWWLIAASRELPNDATSPLSVAAFLGALTSFGYGLGVQPFVFVVGYLFVSAGATALLLWVAGTGSARPWTERAEWLAVASGIAALVAVDFMDEPGTFIGGVLLVLGGQLLLVGMARRRARVAWWGPAMMTLGVFAQMTQSMPFDVAWFAAPIGLLLLVEIEIARAFALTPVDAQIRTAEWVAFALLMLPAVADVFNGSVLAVGILAAVSALSIVWAVAGRLRRRLTIATIVSTSSVILSATAVLAGGAPESATLWIVAVGIGFAVLAAAGVVEAGRARKGFIMRRLDQIVDGWE